MSASFRAIPTAVVLAAFGAMAALSGEGSAAGVPVAARPSVLAELNVPLTIHEVAGVDRKSEICSTGVPLPCGLLKEPEGIAVFSPSGAAVPAQFRVLERWREKGLGKGDLSIKWLLVTFFADVPAGKKAVYRLKAGKNPAPASPVRIEKVGDDHKMGGLVFKKDFTAPFKLVLTNPQGKEVGTEGQSIKWSVWEEGPLRACLRAESPTDHKTFGFIAWVYAYAPSANSGQAGKQRWDMTVVLKNTPRKMSGPFYFKDFSVVWAPAEIKSGREFLLGGERGKTVAGKLAGGRSACLYQDSDGTDNWDTLAKWKSTYVNSWAKLKEKQQGKPEFRGYRATSGKDELGAGNFALGWAGLNGGPSTGSGQAKGAQIMVRHFRENYPKAAEVETGRLTARLWPKYWKGHGGLHWLDDIQRKAHDLSFVVSSGPVTGKAADARAAAFNHPLVAHCGTRWYRRTGTEVREHTEKVFPGRNPISRFAVPWGQDVPEYRFDAGKPPGWWWRDSAPGWVVFGGDVADRHRRYYHQYPMDGFVGTGNPFAAYRMAIGMRHTAAITPFWVDDFQFPRDKGMLRGSYCCPVRRPCGKYRQLSGHHGYMSWNPQHFTCRELHDSWRLFGDPLALDAVHKTARYLQFYFEGRKPNPKGLGETRCDARPMTVVCEAYRTTGEESYLKSAAAFFRDVMCRTINEERGHYRPKPGKEKLFQVYALVNGLSHYHALTADEDAADMILGLTGCCLAETWVPEKRRFLYAVEVDPKKRDEQIAKAKQGEAQGVGEMRMARALAWCYSHTGESRFKQPLDAIREYAKANRRAKYGYMVLAMEYPQRTDTNPPQAVKDLAVTALGGDKVKLTWTVPGGEPARYQVKWADKPMIRRIKWPEQKQTHANWWAANNVAGEPKPGAAGTAQSMLITGVGSGRRRFGIRSFDAASNRSDFSNTAEVVVK